MHCNKHQTATESSTHCEVVVDTQQSPSNVQQRSFDKKTTNTPVVQQKWQSLLHC
jgi:hypothetical protein